MPHVNSSAISYIEYDAASSRLTITFTSGNTYDYDEFPKRIYEAFLQSSSKGRFYNDNIKDKYVAR